MGVMGTGRSRTSQLLSSSDQVLPVLVVARGSHASWPNLQPRAGPLGLAYYSCHPGTGIRGVDGLLVWSPSSGIHFQL